MNLARQCRYGHKRDILAHNLLSIFSWSYTRLVHLFRQDKFVALILLHSARLPFQHC